MRYLNLGKLIFLKEMLNLVILTKVMKILLQIHQNVLNGKNGPVVSDHFAIYVEE